MLAQKVDTVDLTFPDFLKYKSSVTCLLVTVLLKSFFFFALIDKRLITKGLSGVSVVKNPPANAGDRGLIPGLGRLPGEGNGKPL